MSRKNHRIFNVCRISAEFHAADDSDYPEENVEEVNESSTSKGRECGRGRKLRCSSGCGGGRGRGKRAQRTVEEQVYGSYSRMLLILLCDSVSS